MAMESKKLEETRLQLHESGFYYGQLSPHESLELLKNCRPGTFLLRDSSQTGTPFTLSYQTYRGPTSIRIKFQAGQFFTDVTESTDITQLKKFDSIFDLLQFLQNAESLHGIVTSDGYVLIDENGKICPKIFLSQPLKKVPSNLMHLARLAVNKNSQDLQNSEIPQSLKEYLQAYPHTV